MARGGQQQGQGQWGESWVRFSKELPRMKTEHESGDDRAQEGLESTPGRGKEQLDDDSREIQHILYIVATYYEK